MQVPQGPVDEAYRLRPETRAFLRRRRRLHGFDLLAPAVDASVAGRWRGERAAHGATSWVLRWPRPLTLAPRQTLALPLLPDLAGGLLGARVVARGGCRVQVLGEDLPGATRRAWRLKAPVVGRPLLRAGAQGARVERVELFTRLPGPQDLVERHPVHLPVAVGEELLLPLPAWRRGQRIVQLSVHWGSVEYRVPERALELGAWGYPYYLDGVLGDVFAGQGRRERLLARGKFLEFDELENIRGFAPLAADRVRVRLRSRDRVEHPAPCRVASVEVRYAERARGRPRRVCVDREVRPGRPLVLSLPGAGALQRLDVRWSDRGPAMARLELDGSFSRPRNVCSGERFVLGNLLGAPGRQLVLHAALAPYRVHALWLYREEEAP